MLPWRSGDREVVSLVWGRVGTPEQSERWCPSIGEEGRFHVGVIGGSVIVFEYSQDVSGLFLYG